jgi:hypothetical protein
VLAVALIADWATAALPNAAAQPDLAEYHAYALGFLSHHTLPREYPPLSLATFLLTLAPPLGAFPLVFGAWMLALVGVAYALLAREFGPGRGLAFLTYLVAGAAATVLSRFDIVPSLLVLLAFIALHRRRWWACYALLAAGTLFKLFPLFVVPLVAIDQFKSIGPGGREAVARVAVGLGIFLGVVLAGFGLAVVVDPAGAFAPFGYAASRPLEVESGPATLLWLGSLLGRPVHAVFSYGSFNLAGDGDRIIEAGATVALVAAWVFVCVRRWAGRIDAGQAWIFCLCAVVLTNRVLSAQYLIWIFPLVAATAGLDATWLAIALITTLVFPFLFGLDVIAGVGGHLDIRPPVLIAVAVRNALLLVAALRAGLLVRRGQPARPGR